MKAVLDTNAVIYLQKGLLKNALPSGDYFVSVITEMELLSFHGLNSAQLDWLHQFLASVRTIPLDQNVKEIAINLRRAHRVRLPDAIVVASAISFNATLFTNDQQLLNIPNLTSTPLELKLSSSDKN